MATSPVRTLAKILPKSARKELDARTRSKSEGRHRKILIEVDPTDTVLDIGCVRHSLEDIDWQNPEPGEWLHAELRKRCQDVVGIDIIEEDVEKMKESGMEVYTADAESFDLESKFDRIIAGELIEHLSNPGDFLDRCKEHLKDDGEIIITTPNPRRLQQLFWYLTSNKSRVNPEHTMWFDPYVMQQLSSRHGLKVQNWEYYPPSLSLASTPLYNFGLLQPITSGGFVFVLEHNSQSATF